ncbi:site-specific tyrosine recombinase XerC [Cellulomonas palmilytica]|uniref:site-specific tyrosine recombinase XerC n=1 Tax=Cellulomonas palmilytica TaxID=2608402 RepID=UPI001F4080F6|nr:site-specific tyrosine recombinase XerC [Cellulomonas palmilytica]UJP41770.1 site-specific tyrosine recombinase XerC [Cellulomonas palmilytica]
MGRRGVHTPQTIPGDPGDRHGFPALVTEFCTDLAARGYSPATIRARRQALATLAAWLADRGVTRPVEVTRPMLVRYQRHLFHYRKTNGQPLSFRSQNARLLPVRAFFRWAVKNDHLASNPAADLELPKVEHRLPKPALTVGEAEQVLAIPDTTTTAGLRDRAILETFYGTGIRRAELAHLNLRDLDVERRTLTVRQGKGRKDRMIPIGPRALGWIDRYLTAARPRLASADDDGTLFLTVDGTPFSLDRLTQLVRDHVTASGVGKQGACHLFRHTLATLMLEGGADIRYIQAMLGHAELSTTQIYTQVSIRALQAVHAATFPAATTHPPRRGPALVTLTGDGHDGDGAGTPKVSASQLLAALDQEIEEENRPHPGSTPPP